MDIIQLLQAPKNLNSLTKLTKIDSKKLKKILDKYIKDKVVFLNFKKEYCLVRKGTLEVTNKVFGFINQEDSEDDIYIDLKFAKDAQDKDFVSYYIYYNKNDLYKKKPYAEVIEVLKRNETLKTGVIKNAIRKGYNSQIVVLNDENNTKLNIKENNFNLIEDMVVSGTIEYLNKTKIFNIKDILGHVDDPGIEISKIAAVYGFSQKFSEEALIEAQNIKQELISSDYLNREDYRNILTITIDGDDSKDFDDAISVKKDINNNYILYVFIADVSDYVTHNSSLDIEAYKRGTSVYLADRVIPMLPHELSNGICSLNEGVDRKVLAAIITISSNGKYLDYSITEGIINSNHRMTYNKINAMLEGNEDIINEYRDIYDMVLTMNELHEILRDKKENKGALEFEVPEYRFSLYSDGRPKDIVMRERKEAEKLIEDFMITANEVVAKTLSDLGLPCLYRVHDVPSQDKLRHTLNIFKEDGFNIKIPKNDIKPKFIQNVINKINETESNFILNNLLLRSMAKAKYQGENIGHYGLALQFYCHFTSPIRRYPDLIIHRILKELVIHKNEKFREYYNYYFTNIDEIGVNTSNQERKAIECERDVNDMLQAWFAEGLIDNIYLGHISSITKYGMFVILDNGIEGLIHINNMIGYYTYNESNNTLSGNNVTYKLNDLVKIVVLNSDRETRKIDFMLYDDFINLGESNDDSSY